jgi:hypothetical protein
LLKFIGEILERDINNHFSFFFMSPSKLIQKYGIQACCFTTGIAIGIHPTEIGLEGALLGLSCGLSCIEGSYLQINDLYVGYDEGVKRKFNLDILDRNWENLVVKRAVRGAMKGFKGFALYSAAGATIGLALEQLF